jgi:hypothetical protein
LFYLQPMKLKAIFIALSFFVVVKNVLADINISTQKDLLQNSIVNLAINDFEALIEKNSKEKVFINGPIGSININIITTENFYAENNFDTLGKYEHYEWNKTSKSDTVFLTLTAHSYKSIANGLYGLLQEQLEFNFYHPKKYLSPDKVIDWGAIKNFSAQPAFSKRGFHLHTMHPIELTECLLDAQYPNALNEVKTYIDWLARNGQNYFEFNLLESIDKNTWIKHAKKISDYAHQRGVFCGIDLSLHMLQQKAFQLYTSPPKSFQKKTTQIINNAQWLVGGGFDLWNVELSATEFSQGDQQKKSDYLKLLTSITLQNNIKLMSRSHVVKPDKMVAGDNVHSNEKSLSQQHGLMIHTVMFYSLNDTLAPVYENDNLLHMRDLLLQEKTKRETWYYPESAYWVTFDSSVPMYFLPYLSARLEDINYCENQGIVGHLTFSSGWEWAYWTIDWSIARWSWNIFYEGKNQEKYPLQYIENVVKDVELKQYIQESAELQQEFIKDKLLIQVLTAQTVTDEIGGKFNLEFHPRPIYSYKYIRNEATLAQLDEIKKLYLLPLQEYVKKTENKIFDSTFSTVEQEIYDAIGITILRANHKLNTLKYIVEYRNNKLTHANNKIEAYLLAANYIRQIGLEIVYRREQNYSYPLQALSTKHYDHTCYHFGYLYPVHQLHFWEREESQSQKNKYRFWYKGIWNVPRIIGLID